MTLRHLTIFLAVYDEKNMTAAAEKLHIAQPSISQAVAELESHYNIKLFERLGRKLYITQAGQKLAGYARHILHLHREAEIAMNEITDRGLLRIGASVTVGTCLLHRLIRRFMAINTNTRIYPVVNNTKIIEDMLLLDQLDLGLVEGKVHSPLLAVTPFMKDELVLITAPTHPLAEKKKVNIAELNEREFLVREEGSGTRELFESVMASQGIGWTVAGVYNNAEAIKEAVAEGIAVTVISRMSVQNEVKRKDIAIIEVEGVSFQRQFSVVYHKNKFISPPLERFIQTCFSL